MPPHFTYAETLDRSCLSQGDILARTPIVDAILEDVHRHYKKPDYRYLMVLTQSCDLVRRSKGACKARYVSLAAVRPLSLVLEREIEKSQRDPLERTHRIANPAQRDKVRQFVARLLNNNEEDFFYLHPFKHADAEVGIDEAMCAFLALSIAIKSELHYEACLEAKVAQLDETFQHKLGWLTGKMYSRVGTADWVPDTCTQADFDQHVKEITDGACAWIDPEVHKSLLKRIREVPEEQRTPDWIGAEHENLKANSLKKMEWLVERVHSILLKQGIKEGAANTVKNMVASDTEIARLFK